MTSVAKKLAPPVPAASSPNREVDGASERGSSSNHDDDFDLSVHLPNGDTAVINVDPTKPMMDLLVTICAKLRVSPTDHTLQVLSSNDGRSINYKANQPLSSLGVSDVNLIAKMKSDRDRNATQLPFEITQRLIVNLPNNQRYVIRVRPDIRLGDLFKMATDHKNLDPLKYNLRHPTNPQISLNMEDPLNIYGISEVCLVYVPGVHSKTESFTSSSVEQLAMASVSGNQSDGKLRGNESIVSKAEKKKGIFSFLSRKRSGKLSLGSMGSASFNGSTPNLDQLDSAKLSTHSRNQTLTVVRVPTRTTEDLHFDARGNDPIIKSRPLSLPNNNPPVQKKRDAPRPPSIVLPLPVKNEANLGSMTSSCPVTTSTCSPPLHGGERRSSNPPPTVQRAVSHQPQSLGISSRDPQISQSVLVERSSVYVQSERVNMNGHSPSSSQSSGFDEILPSPPSTSMDCGRPLNIVESSTTNDGLKMSAVNNSKRISDISSTGSIASGDVNLMRETGKMKRRAPPPPGLTPTPEDIADSKVIRETENGSSIEMQNAPISSDVSYKHTIENDNVMTSSQTSDDEMDTTSRETSQSENMETREPDDGYNMAEEEEDCFCETDINCNGEIDFDNMNFTFVAPENPRAPPESMTEKLKCADLESDTTCVGSTIACSSSSLDSHAINFMNTSMSEELTKQKDFVNIVPCGDDSNLDLYVVNYDQSSASEVKRGYDLISASEQDLKSSTVDSASIRISRATIDDKPLMLENETSGNRRRTFISETKNNKEELDTISDQKGFYSDENSRNVLKEVPKFEIDKDGVMRNDDVYKPDVLTTIYEVLVKPPGEFMDRRSEDLPSDEKEKEAQNREGLSETCNNTLEASLDDSMSLQNFEPRTIVIDKSKNILWNAPNSVQSRPHAPLLFSSPSSPDGPDSNPLNWSPSPLLPRTTDNALLASRSQCSKFYPSKVQHLKSSSSERSCDTETGIRIVGSGKTDGIGMKMGNGVVTFPSSDNNDDDGYKLVHMRASDSGGTAGRVSYPLKKTTSSDVDAVSSASSDHPPTFMKRSTWNSYVTSAETREVAKRSSTNSTGLRMNSWLPQPWDARKTKQNKDDLTQPANETSLTLPEGQGYKEEIKKPEKVPVFVVAVGSSEQVHPGGKPVRMEDKSHSSSGGGVPFMKALQTHLAKWQHQYGTGTESSSPTSGNKSSPDVAVNSNSQNSSAILPGTTYEKKRENPKMQVPSEQETATAASSGRSIYSLLREKSTVQAPPPALRGSRADSVFTMEQIRQAKSSLKRTSGNDVFGAVYDPGHDDDDYVYQTPRIDGRDSTSVAQENRISKTVEPAFLQNSNEIYPLPIPIPPPPPAIVGVCKNERTATTKNFRVVEPQLNNRDELLNAIRNAGGKPGKVLSSGNNVD